MSQEELKRKLVLSISLDEVVKLLVLILPKMSLKTFKGEDKINKLMPVGIDDNKLLEKYKNIWTKIVNLKKIKFKPK